MLEAAAQVFEREGLSATTNRIAERAGVSIGTVYQYFPNKHALLYTLAERHLAAAHEKLADVFAELNRTLPNWHETVSAVARTVAELHAEYPRLHALLYEYAPRAPEVVDRLHELYRMVTTELSAHVRRCGKAGDSPERTAALLVHAADAQLHRVLLDSGNMVDDLVAALHR